VQKFALFRRLSVAGDKQHSADERAALPLEFQKKADAIDFRHQQITNHQVEGTAFHFAQRVARMERDFHLHLFAAKNVGDQAGDDRFIFYYQNAR